MGILQIFTLLGALGMFLYGMNLMSSGLQKAAGDRLRGLLSAMTSNPFKGVLTGLGITSVIQSSSATTVMIANLNAAHKGQLEGISNAYNAEDRLNNLRNYLRDAEIEEIESNRKNYQTSVYYMDVVSELEKMGDFIINISQNLEKVFVKK
jgi:Na+/phosphate symporter